MFDYALYADAPSPGLSRLTTAVCGTDPSASHAVLLGAVLLVLARGLGLRRRIAWILALGLVAWSGLTELESLVAGTPGEPWRLVPLGLLALGLARARGTFPVPPDRHRLHQACAIAGAASATLLVLGGGGLVAERNRFDAPLSAGGLQPRLRRRAGREQRAGRFRRGALGCCPDWR